MLDYFKGTEKANPTRVTVKQTVARTEWQFCLSAGWPANLERAEISQQLLFGSP